MRRNYKPLMLTGVECGIAARRQPEGLRLYAVGDVHGCFDLVSRAVDLVRRHARGRRHRLIFLGDYVDRGPETQKTVEFLFALEQAQLAICLKGNHEAMMVRAATSSASKTAWLEHGGSATARSYGANADEATLFSRIPAAHLNWLAERPLVHEEPEHVFVHAGLDPARSLAEQGDRELLWIRERFLSAPPDAFAERRHIVHGHTLQWKGKPDPRIPELLAHRTNLDTGAYGTGLLTIGVFEDGQPGGPTDIINVT